MYRRDTAAIRSFIAPGIDGWQDRAAGALMAVAFTMNTPTPDVMGELRKWADDGHALADNPSLTFGNRGHLWREYLNGNMVRVLAEVDTMLIADRTDETVARAIVALKSLKGLAYVKAGFYLQIVYGVAGCIDTRNAQAMPDAYQPSAKDGGKSYAGQYAVALDYVRRMKVTIDNASGGCSDPCEWIWDYWCIGAATQFHHAYATGDDCSAEHVQWVRLAYHGLVLRRGW